VADVEKALGALPRKEVFALFDHIARRQPGEALALLDRALRDGKDCESLLGQLIDHARSLLVLRVCGDEGHLLDERPEDVAELRRQSHDFSREGLLYVGQVLWETLRKVKEGAQSRVPLELALVKLAEGDGLEPLEKLLERLAGLEARLGTSQAATRPAAAEKKKTRPAKQKDNKHARIIEEHDRRAREQEDREAMANRNPVVRQAVEILQGIVVKRER